MTDARRSAADGGSRTGALRAERLGWSAVADTVVLALVGGVVASRDATKRFAAHRRTAGGVPP